LWSWLGRLVSKAWKGTANVVSKKKEKGTDPIIKVVKPDAPRAEAPMARLPMGAVLKAGARMVVAPMAEAPMEETLMDAAQREKAPTARPRMAVALRAETPTARPREDAARMPKHRMADRRKRVAPEAEVLREDAPTSPVVQTRVAAARMDAPTPIKTNLAPEKMTSEAMTGANPSKAVDARVRAAKSPEDLSSLHPVARKAEARPRQIQISRKTEVKRVFA
jgi:hypothetical protein